MMPLNKVVLRWLLACVVVSVVGGVIITLGQHYAYQPTYSDAQSFIQESRPGTQITGPWSFEKNSRDPTAKLWQFKPQREYLSYPTELVSCPRVAFGQLTGAKPTCSIILRPGYERELDLRKETRDKENWFRTPGNR